MSFLAAKLKEGPRGAPGEGRPSSLRLEPS